MATPIVMPKQGNTVEECLLIAWRQRKGDRINAGDQHVASGHRPPPWPATRPLKLVEHITFSLTADHQAVDSAQAARFLQVLKKHVQNIKI